MKYLASLVLAVFFLVVMFAVYQNIFESESAVVGEPQCRASVKILAGSSIWDSSLMRCPTKYLKVENSDTEETKKLIADQISSCWFNFGEGKWDLFETKEWDTSIHNFCHICSVLEFEKQNSVSGVENYLIQKPLENKVIQRLTKLKEKTTYMEYLLQSIDEDKRLIGLSAKIDTSRDYAVIFAYAKQSNLITSRNLFSTAANYSTREAGKPAQLLASSAGLMVRTAEKVGLVDSDEWTANLLFIPYEKGSMKEYCGILE